MSDEQNLYFQQPNGEIRKITVNVEEKPAENQGPFVDSQGMTPVEQMQKAQAMIRGYTEYVIQSFQNFAAAEVEEITLKFGMSLGGEMGIPYITSGKANSNVEISVKCKFPKA